MRAIVSLRVSTEEQGDSGLGLEAQEAACREWCRRNRHEFIGPFVDAGVSGAKPIHKRPGLMDALSEMKRGDVLLVFKRDRLASRDFIIGALLELEMKRRGCRIVSTRGEGTESDDPEDILMRRIVDAFAEYERGLCRLRTKLATVARRRRGEGHRGVVEYGYDLVGKNLVRNEREQEVIARIRDMRQTKSLRVIAAELTEAGVITKKGRSVWSHQAVKRILGRQG